MSILNKNNKDLTDDELDQKLDAEIRILEIIDQVMIDIGDTDDRYWRSKRIKYRSSIAELETELEQRYLLGE